MSKEKKQECKEVVAKKHNYKSWDALIEYISECNDVEVETDLPKGFLSQDLLNRVIDEAMELFASQSTQPEVVVMTELESCRQMLREVSVRAKLVLPEHIHEELWFEQGFNLRQTPDLMKRLLDELGK